MAALTDLEAVRLNIGDVDGDVLTDDQVTHYLTINSDNILLASAGALRAIAASAALVAKLVRRGNLTVDRRQVSKELRELAKVYEMQDETEPATAVAEQSVSQFAAEQIVLNDALSEG